MSFALKCHHLDLNAISLDAVRYVVERGLYGWMMDVQDQLTRQIARNELSRDEAMKIYALRFGCYKCCQRALKEGRLP
jgi:hypothetical protein